MRKIILAFSAFFLFAFSAIAEPRAWSFVQTVGGVAIGIPVKNENGWLLPVRSDVSGLQTITVKPTTLNSGLACQRTEAIVEGKSIYLTIITGVASSGSSSLCPAASLGQLSAGKYSVLYRGLKEQPIPVDEVTIGL